MNSSRLSKHFSGLAAKKLRAGELEACKSNQHEFNGVNALRAILGDDHGETIRFPTKFIYIGNNDQDACQSETVLSWYNSRRNQLHRAAEYRLYYSGDLDPISKAKDGDLLVIAKCKDNSLIAIIAGAGSTSERQVSLLFGLNSFGNTFTVNTSTESINLGFAGRYVLEQLGIETALRADEYLAELVERFGDSFPTTRVFSEYARTTLPHVSPLGNPDLAIMEWMEREEALFRSFEQRVFNNMIRTGILHDIDFFMELSLSFHNRRKARVGQSLEHHLEAIFHAHGLKPSRGGMTEGKSKPDFIFPSIRHYHNPRFPPTRLTLLGAKSSCKDRWRQVLSEGNRVKEKHLFTLEPAISQPQTDEMANNHLQLIVPVPLHCTYNIKQQTWLYSLNRFIEMTKKRELGD